MNGIILDNEWSRILTKPPQRVGINPAYQEVLFSLLLYGKAYLPHIYRPDGHNYIDDLKKYDLVSVIPPNIYKEEEKRIIRSINQYQYNLDMLSNLDERNGYTDKIIANLRAGDPDDLISKEILSEELSENVKFYANNSQLGINLNKEIIYEYYKRKYSSIYPSSLLATFAIERHSVGGMSLKSALKYGIDGIEDRKALMEDLVDYDFKKDTDEMTLNQVNWMLREYGLSPSLYKTRQKKLDACYRHLVKQEHYSLDLDLERLKFTSLYADFSELINFSRQFQIPIKGKIGSLEQFRGQKPLSALQDSYCVFQMILDEINFMPKLSHINDVLRLREDKRIADFREVINAWTAAVDGGDHYAMVQIRKDIRSANLEFKRFQQYQKIGGWITYASLPMIVVDVLTQVPTGSLLTIVGAVTQFTASKLNRKNQWLLLGNQI